MLLTRVVSLLHLDLSVVRTKLANKQAMGITMNIFICLLQKSNYHIEGIFWQLQTPMNLNKNNSNDYDYSYNSYNDYSL